MNNTLRMKSLLSVVVGTAAYMGVLHVLTHQTEIANQQKAVVQQGTQQETQLAAELKAGQQNAMAMQKTLAAIQADTKRTEVAIANTTTQIHKLELQKAAGVSSVSVQRASSGSTATTSAPSYTPSAPVQQYTPQPIIIQQPPVQTITGAS